MELSEVLHLVSQAFGKTKGSFFLVGGFAVNYYKFSRRTIDIDFLTTEKEFGRALPLLAEGGYQPLHPAKGDRQGIRENRDLRDLSKNCQGRSKMK